MKAKRITRELLFSSAPLFLTLLLILWTLLTAPITSFGNRWAVYPAIFVLPLTFLFHVGLIVKRRPRAPFILYAIVHLSIQWYAWQMCLILISKDWL
jgi:hypothetical protein